MALDVVLPESVGDSVAMLAADAGARLVGGGTLLLRDVNYDAGEIGRLVLADKLKLAGIATTDRRVTIGGSTTMATIAARAELSFLKPVAEAIGGPAVRNMATVAGNLFAPYPFGDFAVALLALNASVTVTNASGERTVELGEFLTSRSVETACVVTDVGFNLPADGAFRFVKVMRRHPRGASVLSIAVTLPTEDGRITRAGVAYGAMAPTAMRATAVENVLEGKPLDDDSVDAALAVATQGCAPLSDPQASDWYRLTVLPIHLKRLLTGKE